jgi:hypothetical protein
MGGRKRTEINNLNLESYIGKDAESVAVKITNRKEKKIFCNREATERESSNAAAL